MGTIWCRSTSSTRTRRLRKRESSTRRKASTTWSRRRPKRYRRSQPANLSVSRTFKHVGKFVSCASCIRMRVHQQQDASLYVSVLIFFQKVLDGVELRLLEKRFRVCVPGEPVADWSLLQILLTFPALFPIPVDRLSPRSPTKKKK